VTRHGMDAIYTTVEHRDDKQFGVWTACGRIGVFGFILHANTALFLALHPLALLVCLFVVVPAGFACRLHSYSWTDPSCVCHASTSDTSPVPMYRHVVSGPIHTHALIRPAHATHLIWALLAHARAATTCRTWQQIATFLPGWTSQTARGGTSASTLRTRWL
jgi:hypothetical protein